MIRLSLASSCVFMLSACASSSAFGEQQNEMIVTPETKPVADAYHYAPIVRAGEFVFISGVPAALPNIEDASAEEIRNAVKIAYLTAFHLLEQAGVSKYDVVDITTFHTNLRATQNEVLQVHKELFDQEPYPAWTVVGVDALFMETAFFELKVTARIQE